METTIRLKPSELTGNFLDMLKMLAEKKGYKEISISMTDNIPAKRLRKESASEAKERMASAINDINSGDTNQFISFSAEEFEQFSHSLLKK